MFGATGPGIWGERRDPDECKRVLRRALELDVNVIDSADSYGPQVSERLIAEALGAQAVHHSARAPSRGAPSTFRMTAR